MTSLYQFVQKFASEFSKLSLPDEGLCGYLDKAMALFQSDLLGFVSSQISEIDDVLASRAELRPEWHVFKGPTERTLETKWGTLRFSRRYYRHQETGEYAHLVDRALEVRKYARIEDGLLASLGASACTHSYQTAAQEEAGGRVSRMSVYKAIGSLKVPVLPETQPRRVCRELHLQADEDHVHLQKSHKKSAQIRLVAIHEPKTEVRVGRYALAQRELMSSVQEAPEEFWWRVLDRLDAIYDMPQVERIYLHGDGASWIRAGLDIIPGSVFILDGFHLERALNRLCAGQARLKSRIRSCLYPWNEQRLNREIKMLADSCVCQEQTATDTLKYLCNQREGIENHYALAHGGSCAEGLVSHVLSKRFSRDPLGWSVKSLRSLSDLRTYQLNGGVVDRQLLPPQTSRQVPEWEWLDVVSEDQKMKRQEGLGTWQVMIPGSQNTGSSLGGWLKGLKQGGYVN